MTGQYKCTECGERSDAVGQSFDHALKAHGSSEAYIDEMRTQAMSESFRRLKASGADRHDDGLIAAALLYGYQWFSIASRLGIADGYVLGVKRSMGL